MTRHTVFVAAGFAFAALAVVAGGQATAQTARSGGDSQRATQQLQQLASERAAAQADAAKAKQALADAQKQLTLLTAERDALRAKANGMQSTVAGAEGKERAAADELLQTKSKMAELVGKFRETATTLRDVEANRTQIRSSLANASRDYQTCAEHNAELAGLAREVLDRYDGSKRTSGFARHEPFTRIARTRVENLADEYRARLEDLKLPPRAEPAPAGDTGTH